MAVTFVHNIIPDTTTHDFSEYISNFLNGNSICSHLYFKDVDIRDKVVIFNYEFDKMNSTMDNIFKNNIKKGKFKLDHLITYIENYEKTINKLNRLFSMNYYHNINITQTIKNGIRLFYDDIDNIKKILTYNTSLFQGINIYISNMYEELYFSDEIENDFFDVLTKNIYTFKNKIKYFYYMKEFEYVYPSDKMIKDIKIKIENIFKSSSIGGFYTFVTTYLKSFCSIISITDTMILLIKNKLITEKDPNNIITIFKIMEILKIKRHANEINFKFDETVIDIIVKEINNNILNKKSNQLYYNILTNVDEQLSDYMITSLFTNLIKRIIYSDKFDYETEIRDHGNIHKYHLFDKITYYKYIEIIKNSKTTDNIYNVSYGCWNLDFKCGHITFNDCISYNSVKTNELYKLEQYFDMDNKRPIFYPHLGYVDVEIDGRLIKMLPIQYICMDMEQKDIDSLFHKYNKDYMKNVVSSLKFIKDETDLIDVFYNISPDAEEVVSNIIEELLFDKIEIIASNINSIIKTGERFILYDVENSLFSKIKTPLFDIDKELFSKAITYMKDEEYIKYEQINELEIIEKYVW